MILRAALFACALSAGLLATDAPALAQAAPEAAYDVTAVAYRELPDGAPVRLQLLDDSELNQQLRTLIADQLTTAGHPVDEAAPFVLQVETQTASEAEADPNLGSFEAGNEGAEIRMNLWSSREDSLLNRRDDAAPGGTLYRISLGLYDGEDGRYYWRGQVSTILGQADAAGASRDMVPALLAHFGKTMPPAAPPGTP
jgi:hypothetical protein